MGQTLFNRVTDRIVAAIEAGPGRFSLPWHRSGSALHLPGNASSGRIYSGINVVTLWVMAEAGGYNTGRWATYRQWQDLGAQVRRGEKGVSVVFWQQRGQAEPHGAGLEKGGGDENDPGSRRGGFVARSYVVFNADQVDGFVGEEPMHLSEGERLLAVENAVAATGASIRHGGDAAWFSPGQDVIQMPDFGRFRGREAYYAVLAHELTHWTGTKHRLDRQLTGRFGSEAYAMEELVAELGAAFACARLGISTEPRPDHAAYMAAWLKVIRHDPRAIFTAAARAQEAVDYLFPSSTQ